MKLPSLWTQRDITDPFHAMRREMDDFFSDFTRRWPMADAAFQAPVVDIAETKDAYEVTAELPGVDQNDIKLSIDGNCLMISGEKRWIVFSSTESTVPSEASASPLSPTAIAPIAASA